MEDHSPHLQIIGQLAREYEQKYKELETLVSQSPEEMILPQLKALSERTTDRFRAAQITLLSVPGLFEGKEKEKALLAATALCSAFDEMRILFQFLVDSRAKE